MGQADAEKFSTIPLSNIKRFPQGASYRYGVPFLIGKLNLSIGGSASVKIGGSVKRIYLLGMTESPFIGAWADPTNDSVRCFVGDNMGQIQLNYADGTTRAYPLVMGETIWWGEPFYNFPEPFPSSPRFRKALASSLCLYPPTPVRNGQYVAVITPDPAQLDSITISSSPAKRGTPQIAGITVETAGTNEIAVGTAFSPLPFAPEFQKFVLEKNLPRANDGDKDAAHRLQDLRLAFYTSDADYGRHVALKTPDGYTGPQVLFKGDITAEILANVFTYNVQDIHDKIDEDGMYHTSTKGAVLWGRGGGQFGSYVTNGSCYYRDSWTRDMGRSLQELTELGYTNDAAHCADYCLRVSRLWEQSPAPTYGKGQFYPPHWSRTANRPSLPPFENDGHGLVIMFLYKLWQRMPDRDDWLRARWPDIKNSGDWILWQFDHPDISGATNGVLHTTGESAGGPTGLTGWSVYADSVCMDSLRALAQMADSIGKTNSANEWRQRADNMQKAITSQYIVDDPQYGRVWTLDHAGWPTHPTVLGPIIFRADFQGFAPKDEDDDWQTINDAAYQRLIDTYRPYQPFGYYGQAMGYGQGFITESALLLDRMRDVSAMLDWIAKQVYDPKLGFFIVPEGVQIDPTGKFWYRAGDLGNGVQEAEIVKVLRLVIGVDDTHPDRLQFYPRMPYHWNEMMIKKYPVLYEKSGKMETAFLHYQLKRTDEGMILEIGADQALGPVAMRLGPFSGKPEMDDIQVNGESPSGATTEQSGDSWWITFTMPVSPDEKDE